ncbi:MAG: hypothetical protein IT580_04020, partial [Verrucomicrobiales bacterium]|nr:hypothetical protein [Verrucomicrobiales bacterium]
MSQEPSGTAGVPPARRDSRGGSRGGSSAPPSRRWIWISLVLVLALGTAAYFGARPAWRAVKVARAKSFLRETDAMVAKEDWTLAFQRSRSAQQLAPFHPEVVRHSAQLHARFGLETGLRFYEQLLAMPAATDSDRLGYVELALKLGAMESAWSQLDDLLAAPAPPPHALVLGAQYFAFRRNPLRALALARSAVAAEPNNPTNAMALAVLLGASRNAADKAEATRMLMPVASASGPLQLRALSALLSMPEVARGDRERATAVLEAMPQRGQEAELLWYDARIALDVTLRPRLADEAVDRWARGTPLELAQLGGWLNRHGLYQRTLDLVLADAALAQEALFRVRYDALVGAGAIRDAYEFVLLDRVPGDPMLVEQLRVATAARLRDTKAVQSHLRAMLDATKGNPRQLRIVAEVAQRYQQRGIADEAHRVLSRNKR